MTTAIAETTTTRLKRLFIREDAVYDYYSTRYQAKTPMGKLVYLGLYLLPGLLVFIGVNIGPLFRWEMAMTGWSAPYVQYAWVLIITFGWHILVPFLVLRYSDKLSLQESCAFLGLNRSDWRGLLTVLPMFMAGFAIISLPYVKYLAPVIEGWTRTIPLFGYRATAFSRTRPKTYIASRRLHYFFWGSGTSWARSCTFVGT